MTDIPVRSSRFIPWIFVIGMLTVVAVNGVLIYCAMTTWSGLSVNQSYDRGLVYNHALLAADRQAALGWVLEPRLRPMRSEAELVVAAKDNNSRVLGDLGIVVTLERPVGAPQTQTVALHYTDGVYSAMVPLGRGQWEARITASRGADALYMTQRLILP